jgi:hypothetical protein
MRGFSMELSSRASVCLASWMMVGLFSPAVAGEKREIPDHSHFESCGPCHRETQSAWEKSGHSAAIRSKVMVQPAAQDCAGCHASKSGTATQGENIHKQACKACHSTQNTEYPHRLLADPGKICSWCHPQSSVFWGKGAKGIEDSRNFHSGVPCIGCHMTEATHAMKVVRPDDPGLTGKRQDSCTACHMDNNREARIKQIQEWQSTYREAMEPLLADIKSIDADLKNDPGRLDARAKGLLADVKANLAILQNDGSNGFHNFVFSLEITSMAAQDLKEIRAALKN